jgi:hypothetical protein
MSSESRRRDRVTGRAAPVDPQQREKRTSIGGQFAPRLIEMLESPAYRVLCLGAHRVIARIEIELGHHGGADNGKLPITYDQFQEYGMDRQTVGPAIREAQALGFITVIAGRAGNAEFRSPSLYGLTYHNRDATHEWRQIKTIEDALAIRLAARRTDPASPARVHRIMKMDLAARQSGGRTNLIKNNSPVGKNNTAQCGKPPLKTEIPSGENPHYSHSGEIPTTSISPLQSKLSSSPDLSKDGTNRTLRTVRVSSASVIQILRYHTRGLATVDIMKATGIASRNAMDVKLHALAKQGAIERLDRGWYGIPGSMAAFQQSNIST